MTSAWDSVKAVFLPDGRGRALPRFDFIVIVAAAAVGVLLVLADVYQRALSHHMELLDIDAHWNIETWFHSAVLAGAAFSAAAIGCTYFNRLRVWWFVLGAGLAFFSMDKTTSLHERVGEKLASRLDLPSGSARIAWEVAWSPIILMAVVALVLCVWQSRNGRLQLWSGGLLLGGAAKIVLEALTYPAIRFLGASQSHGWFYGIEANVEESAQLIGFACAFAGFSQFFVERVVALAREELDAFEAAQVPLALPVRVRERMPSFLKRHGAGSRSGLDGRGVAHGRLR